MKWVILCLLFFWNQHVESKVEISSHTFSLNLRVLPEEWERTKNGLQELMDLATQKDMSGNVQLLVRTALEKVTEKYKELEAAKKKEEEEAKKAAQQPRPVEFADKLSTVKPLKAGMAAKKNLKVERYTMDQVIKLHKSGKLDMTKPFLITNGLNELTDLQYKFMAEKLMENKNVRVRYLSPVLAKKKRKFDKEQQQQQNEDEEQLEAQIITLEQYFRECFNHGIKQDSNFRRMAGYGTEHCEQILPVESIYPEVVDYKMDFLEKFGFTSITKMHKDRYSFLQNVYNEISPMLEDGVADQLVVGSWDSRTIVMGSAGSGEQLKQDELSFVDGLVYGKRRWMFLTESIFSKMRQRAKGVMEPASAFQFFEQQFTELKEDFDLGSRSLPYMECNQEAGDLLYVPSKMYRITLSLKDSISISQKLIQTTSEGVKFINQRMWAPESGVIPTSFAALVCYKWDFGAVATLDGSQLYGMQAQLISQIMRQNIVRTTRAENGVIIGILSDCVAAAADTSISSRTYCPKLWSTCVSTLKTNLNSLSLPAPSWAKPKSF